MEYCDQQRRVSADDVFCLFMHIFRFFFSYALVWSGLLAHVTVSIILINY